MRTTLSRWKIGLLMGVAILASAHLSAQQGEAADSLPRPAQTRLSQARRFVHRIGIEGRTGHIFPTNPFLQGDNMNYGQPIKHTSAAFLKYSFGLRPGTYAHQVYNGAYQGIGVGRFDFGSRQEIGNPVAIYLFQGARIARLLPRLSLNYEWNFGLSLGWKPYHKYDNPNNIIMGSKANAYIDAGLHLCWMVFPWLDLNVGATASHFSNGNTRFPNSGLNTTSLKVGLSYNFGRELGSAAPAQASLMPLVPFVPHISYDLTLFGSWRRKAVNCNDGSQVPSPLKYTVAGFSIAPMYNVGYKFRTGVSLDAVYDGSTGTHFEAEYNNYDNLQSASFPARFALGLSARAEWVMPYFSVGLGLGANLLHSHNDMKAFYQVLSLKIDVTRSAYLHVGYNLKNFHEPNYLMLGIGYRFNNRRPQLNF